MENEYTPRKTRKVSVNWKEKYMDYYIRGWQFDTTAKHTKIETENNNFTAFLTDGSGYHGIRGTKEVQVGENYFEIFIDIPSDSDVAHKFDRGDDSGLSIGIAASTFDVENCTSGWTNSNSGVGYYSGK